MGAKASKKRGSTTRQSGGATDKDTLTAGRQNTSEQPNEPGQVDSSPRGDTKSDSPEGAGSSEQVTPKEAVKMSNVAEVAAATNDGDAVTTETEEKEPEQSTAIDMSITQWIGFREIFVQYIPGSPYTLTEFGARLYTNNDRHVFMAIDGTGLARAVGLRNYDVLLSINNLESHLDNAQQLAVLECFSDIGTSIGLVIQRNRNEAWLFAFHLNEKANRPVVENLFSHRIDSEGRKLSFPFFVPVIPDDSAFPLIPDYTYLNSIEVEIVLENGDRFMEIDTDKATYVVHRQTVTLNFYQNIIESDDGGIPIAISTPSTSSCGSDTDSDTELDRHDGRKDQSPMCIEAVGSGPLGVIAFPPYMTQPGTSIPQNDMFFIITTLPTGSSIFKAANTQQQELFIASDVQSPNLWIASLGTPPSLFKIESNGSAVTSLKDLLKLFNSQDG